MYKGKRNLARDLLYITLNFDELYMLIANSLIKNNKYKTYVMIKAGSSKSGEGDPYPIRNVIVHPKFDLVRIDYDVAVIEIIGSFNRSQNQMPIALSSNKNIESMVGFECKVTGFGSVHVRV